MISIIGIAGSGKSTQRDLLAQQLNCPWIYPGQLLRDNLDGEELTNLLAGKIINDDITIPLLDKDLIKKDAKNQECILDGAPRTMPQAEWFVGLIKTGQIKLTGLIHLAITQEEAQRRLAGRARQDDNQQSIAERFKVYETRTWPVLGYLASHGITVHDVPASAPPEEVNHLIQQALNFPVAAKVAQ